MIPNKESIENTQPTLSENCLLSDADRVYPKGTLLKWVLDYCPNTIFQGAIQSFDVNHIFIKLKSNMAEDFPKYRDKDRRFHYATMNIEFCEDMREYQADWQFLQECNRQINKIRIEMKLLGSKHPKYLVLALMHDSLVVANNRFNEPIDRLIEDYKNARIARGKKVKIVNKKETIKIPALTLGVR